MTRLLHIHVPRGEASESVRIAGAFVEAYADAHPTDDRALAESCARDVANTF